MPKEHETARTRVLSDEEIRTLINGFDQTRYGRGLRLLFLTALRREEVLGLKWSWIDLERGVLTIPPSVEKTGRVRDELRRAGLPPQAVALLGEQRSTLFAEGIRSEYVFGTTTGERPHPDSLKPILYRLRGRRSNGWPPSKDKRTKQRNAVLPDDVNIHDIRRTVVDALLNRIGAQDRRPCRPRARPAQAAPDIHADVATGRGPGGAPTVERGAGANPPLGRRHQGQR
jgi:integrase